MLRILLTCALLFLFPAMSSAQFVRIAGETEIPVPDNWYLATDTLDFPAQIIYQGDSAEILLFRSILSSEDIVTNQDELKGSVDLVIADVIETLPEGQLHTSTGFFDGYRAGFVLEFGSTDSASGTLIEHRLKGVIYRHPDGHQILFTIWGKCAQSNYTELREAITFVQDGFVYRGEQMDNIFGERSMSYWPIVLVALALLGLMLLRPRKRKKNNESDSFNQSA
jgi:hypothetical protein